MSANSLCHSTREDRHWVMGAPEVCVIQTRPLNSISCFLFRIVSQPNISPTTANVLKMERGNALLSAEEKKLNASHLHSADERRMFLVIAGLLSTSFASIYICLMSWCWLCVRVCVRRRKRTRRCCRRRCSTWDRTTCDCRRRARRQRLSSGSLQSGSFTPLTRNPEREAERPAGRESEKAQDGLHSSWAPTQLLLKTPRWSTGKQTFKQTITGPQCNQDSLKSPCLGDCSAALCGIKTPIWTLFLGTSSVWSAGLFLMLTFSPSRRTSLLGNFLISGVGEESRKATPPGGPRQSPWDLLTVVECKAHLL